MKLNRASLLKDTVIYGFGDFIVTGVNGFLLLPIYIKYLSQAQYGMFSLFNMSLTIFTYFIQFGLISAFSRVYFLYENEERKNYINNTITLHFLYVFALSAILYFFGPEIKAQLSPSLATDGFYYAYLAAFLSFLPGLFSIKFRLDLQAKKFVYVQIATAIGLIISVIVGLIVLHKALTGLLLAIICSNAALWLYFFIKMLPQYRPYLNKDQLSKTFKLALPMFFSYLMLFLVNKFSLILLQKNIPLDKIAVFSFSQQLSSILIVISVAAGKAIQPVIFDAKTDSLNEVFSKIDEIYKKVLFIISVLLILFAKELVLLLSNANYAKDISIFYILVIANFFFTSVLLQNTLLQYFLKSKWLFYCLVFGGSTSVAANYFLIPALGVYGAATAILLSFFAMAVANYYYTNKLIEHKVIVGYVLTILKIIGVTACAWFLSQLHSMLLAMFLKIILSALLLYHFYQIVDGKGIIANYKLKRKILG